MLVEDDALSTIVEAFDFIVERILGGERRISRPAHDFESVVGVQKNNICVFGCVKRVGEPAIAVGHRQQLLHKDGRGSEDGPSRNDSDVSSIPDYDVSECVVEGGIAGA